MLLESRDIDIPIALNFTTPPKFTQAKDNQAANKSSNKKSSSIISDTERYALMKNMSQKFKTRTAMRNTV